jgi:hypothetical protein
MKKILVLIFSFFILLSCPAKTFAGVDYKLPYPGILPNNPLWPVKDLRDKAISLFIFDSVTKAQYYLRQADKRFAAGLALNDKEVLRWAYEYLGEAAKNKEIFPQVSLALLKYEEELGANKTDPDFIKLKERINILFFERLTPNP